MALTGLLPGTGVGWGLNKSVGRGGGVVNLAVNNSAVINIE